MDPTNKFYGDKQTVKYPYATSRLAAEHKRDRVAPSLRACSLLGGAFQPGRNGEGRLILSHESEGLHPSGGPPTIYFYYHPTNIFVDNLSLL